MSRSPAAQIDPTFIERWSTRSFSGEPLEEGTMERLLEAARWAPSAFNEQPWRFVYADSEPQLSRFREVLGDWNRQWADRAPVLLFVLARRHHAEGGKPNRWAGFDTGAAWMSLAIQARMLGLYTHPMGGFDEARAHELLGTSPEEWEVMVAVTVGHRDPDADLPEEIAEIEAGGPNDRKNPADIALRA